MAPVLPDALQQRNEAVGNWLGAAVSRGASGASLAGLVIPSKDGARHSELQKKHVAAAVSGD